MLLTLVLIVGAYLLGSVSFAIVVSRAFRLPDPHGYGSGNPGATNVLRTGHRLAATLTLLGDGAKGFIAVFIAQRIALAWGGAEWTAAAAALAVFVGHLYPVFHRFAGGKGVATAAGIVFALHWPLGIALAALSISRGALFPPNDPTGLEVEKPDAPTQIVVMGTGHWQGEGMALVEAIT